jgi:DNA-binding transcriptional ArsR family regulator
MKMEKNSIKGLNYIEMEKMAETLKVISHPTRIAILGLLEEGEKLTVTEIYQQLDIEQAPASHHLGLLKNRGLLKSVREGKSNYYFIDKEAMSNVMCCFKRCTNNI